MTTLTDRLRDMSLRGHWPLIGYEAADEIERLRALLLNLKERIEYGDDSAALVASIDAALKGTT